MKRLLYPVLAALTVLVMSCNKEYTVNESIFLNPPELDLSVGQEYPLSCITASGKVLDKDVQWTSDTPSIVNCLDDGTVEAKKEGSAVITARGGEKEATCTIKVTIPVQDMWFQYGDLTISMNPGEIMETSLRISPADATQRNNITWINANPSVVGLERNDPTHPFKIKVTARDLGVATITAKCGGKEAKLVVYVDEVPATKVTVSPVSVTMKAGETRKLTATVEPNTTTNKSISWESSDSKVASVSEDGTVTAHRAGTATVTGCCGNCKAACSVTVTLPDGAVDLGLSVYWAECNLGAMASVNPGDFYAWGELTPKSTYEWSNYKFRISGADSSVKLSRYNTQAKNGEVDGKTDLREYDYVDDAARQKLGGQWRVPSYKEFWELYKNCTSELFTIPSLGNFLRFTSKLSGYTDRSIVFPVSNSFKGYEHTAKYGYYWTSSIYCDFPDAGSMAMLGKDGDKIFHTGAQGRFCGLNIRPVW